MTALILKAARLIDGTGAPPMEHPVIVVNEGKITGIFQGAAAQGAAPANAEVIELPGATLLPGLIDAHVHLNLPGDGTPFPDSVAEGAGVLLATSAHNARVALYAGITTLRDCGGMGTTTFDLRRALALGYGEGARLVLCGQPITITGGHCRYFGGEADGVEGVRQMARQMAKLGADYIKVMGSGGGTPGTMSWLPAFRKEEIAALADEAHRLGRKIAVHCLCAEANAFAAAAGVDQIEHAGFLTDAVGNQRFDEAVAAQIAASGAVVCPTLSVGRFIIKEMEAKGSSRSAAEQAQLDRWNRMLEENLQGMAGLRKAGVTFVAGTDAGWRFTPFDGLVDELELMQQGGLSAMECLVAATSRAAQALDIGAQVGTLQVGLEADIIAVDGNPMERLGALRSPRLVMQAGKRYVG